MPFVIHTNESSSAHWGPCDVPDLGHAWLYETEILGFTKDMLLGSEHDVLMVKCLFVCHVRDMA